jgi:outer membrane protein insertion porin family
MGYSITQKEYSILDENDYVSQELQELVDEGKKLTSKVSGTLERDGRDNVFRPTQGSLVRSITQLAGGPFRGDIDFYKQIFQTNWYHPLFWETALGVKWRFGYTKAFGDSKAVPPEERFYPGGIGPDGIRGYSERSVPGYEGGNAELILSSEISIPIASDQLFGVLFFDAGNAYKYLSDINVHDLKKGAGIGIRIMTPFGPLGFDYAYGFDKETGDKWEFHFQLGTIF